MAGAAFHRRRWRPGVVAACVAGAVVSLAPAYAVLRPSPAHGRGLVAGARLWRAGGGTVVVVDDLKASAAALLSSLHNADVQAVDVLVVTRPGVAAASNVDALLRRFPPRLLVGPPGNRLPGDVAVPPPGATVAAGTLVLTFGADGPRLTVTVATGRLPDG